MVEEQGKTKGKDSKQFGIMACRGSLSEIIPARETEGCGQMVWVVTR